jgi:hypothetical protein
MRVQANAITHSSQFRYHATFSTNVITLTPMWLGVQATWGEPILKKSESDE